MLDVLLHERRVGSIVREPSNEVLSFVVDDVYAEDADRPVLGQQFEDRRHHRVFRQAAHPGRLPTFFANLLPEGALQAMIEAQQPGAGDAGTLAFVGEDLPGAVVVRPQGPAEGGGEVFRARTFDEPPLAGPLATSDVLHFSLAGVQLKLSAVRSTEQRFTLPFRGQGGRWILKFASPGYPSLPENEYAVMGWGARAGLNMPRIELVQATRIDGLDQRLVELGPSVFVIERYDRTRNGRRIHQEDFAQVRGLLPEDKYRGASYDGLARLIGDLSGLSALEEYLRRVMFMILCGNTDGHLKNWSLLYPDGHRADLAPAYDFVCVRLYPKVDRHLALPLAKERTPERLTWEHIQRLERYLRGWHDVPVVDLCRSFRDRCLDAWSNHRRDVEQPIRDCIDQHLASLPLARS